MTVQDVKDSVIQIKKALTIGDSEQAESIERHVCHTYINGIIDETIINPKEVARAITEIWKIPFRRYN